MVKRMMAGVMTLLLLCLCVGCGNNRSADMPETVPNSDESTLDADAEETENIESETEDSMEQKQILVAYFSRTGNTEKAACFLTMKPNLQLLQFTLLITHSKNQSK